MTETVHARVFLLKKYGMIYISEEEILENGIEVQV